MLIRFRLRDPAEVGLTGFELGDIEVGISGNTVSSAGRVPCQSNMSFISISTLLDGVRKFLQGSSREFTFIAADSSFRIVFARLKNGLIQLRIHDELELASTVDELVQVLWDAASRFYKVTNGQLREDAIARGDFESALEEFELLLSS